MSTLEAIPSASLVLGWREFSLDNKGHLVLPRDWHGAIGLPFILVPSIEGRLHGMNLARYEALLAAGGEHPLFWDRMLQGAEIIATVDETTGRFLIPRPLRQFARLRTNERARLVGKGDCFEILNAASWREEMGETL